VRRLKRAAQVGASVSALAVLGVTAFLVVSALVGRSLPFTGGFTSSEEPLSFDRLVTRASERSDSAAGIPTSTPTAHPTPVSTVAPVASYPAVVSPGSPDGSEPIGDATTSVSVPTVETSTETNGAATVRGWPDRSEPVRDSTTSASLRAAETSTESKGATTVAWESSFADLDYTLGDTLTVTINWTVDSGAASYDRFVLRGDTPTSKKDPAAITNDVVTYPGANGPTSVDVSFTFAELHLNAERNVEIGNGHFKLYLRVDADGDGRPETLAGYGVNVHVEDPL